MRKVFAPFTHREMVNHFGEPVAVYWAADTFYPLIYGNITSIELHND